MNPKSATIRTLCLLGALATSIGLAYATPPAPVVGLGCEPVEMSCQAHSHFQPSIGRFGLLPPRPVCPHPVPPDTTCELDPCAQPAAPGWFDFSPDLCYPCEHYDACQQVDIYAGRTPVAVQRPWIEWGLPFYDRGPIPPSQHWCGCTNPVQQKFYVYGDWRTGVAYNRNLATDGAVIATRLNLELDYWITSTERLHLFTGPFQDGASFFRLEDGRVFDSFDLWSADTDTLFFEGDLGQMVGGWTGQYASFDMPITFGLIPMVFQNGTWMLDAFWGAAVTLPARNSPGLDWSNYDITFFAAADQVSTNALPGDNHAGALLGGTTFIEARGGYLELGYAYVSDDRQADRDYHNLGISYTRRYLGKVSNSVRVIVNAGQQGPSSQRTANGALLLIENSLITQNPYNMIPYVNFFAGFDRPQPAARAAVAGGVLFNTGILFQTDGLTGQPTLDASGQNTVGAAFGLDLLAAPDFDQQLILEAAFVHAKGQAALRNAAGNQFGLGARWQLPLTNAWLMRVDAMHGWLENARDISGIRGEMRWKF